MSKHKREDDVQRVYAFVLHYIRTNRRPPTQREIAEGTFLARSSVVRFLDILAARGMLEREDNVARGLSLPPDIEL